MHRWTCDDFMTTAFRADRTGSEIVSINHHLETCSACSMFASANHRIIEFVTAEEAQRARDGLQYDPELAMFKEVNTVRAAFRPPC